MRHSRCAGYIASFAHEKSEHERFCEKEDCRYSKGKMGKGSKFETGDRFRQTRGQKDRIQYGYPSEVIGEIESVLGGEEKTRQEVIPRFSSVPIPCRRSQASDRLQ